MTDQERQDLINDIIVALKDEGVNIANATIETSLNNIMYFVGYDSNRKPIRLNVTAITDKTTTLSDAIAQEVTRAQAKEDELEEGLENVQNKLNTTESVTEVSWGASSNMNSFTTAGVYNIKGERTNANDNLPITNIGANATIAARLIVTVTPEGATTYRHSVGQTLVLSNAEGKETKVYTRNGNRTSNDGGVTYTVTWGEWANLQTNVNVGQVTSLDSFIDNGIYSGVFVESGVPSTFVMIVINDYFVGVSPRRVSQFLYKLNKADGTVSFIYRVGVGNSVLEWGSWVDSTKELQGLIDKNATDITNEETRAKAEEAAIRKLITDLIGESPETLDSIHEISSWILNDKTGAAAMATAISENKIAIEAEVERAAVTEEALANELGKEMSARLSSDNDIKSKAALFGMAVVRPNTNSIEIEYKNVNQEATGTISIPAATPEKAGVMSANDKQKLEASAESFEFYTEKERVALEISANSGNLSEVYIPAATTETAGVMTAEDKVTLDTATSRALRALFVAAGAEYNDTGADKTKTAPWGETVIHKAGYYYLNGLGDITEEQMMVIYNEKEAFNNIHKIRGNQYFKSRTFLIPVTSQTIIREYYTKGESLNFTWSNCSSLEILKFANVSLNTVTTTNMLATDGSIRYTFYKDAKLRIIYPIDVSSVTSIASNTFEGCTSLTELRVFGLNVNLPLDSAPSISKDSVLYIINNASPTSARTITLHPDAYARLAKDTDIVAALEAQPLITLVSA